MSSVECLREFVNERLTAAAEEIFGVFQKTIVEYEEEIYRQRKLLDIVCKPEIKLHRIDLQQPRVCKEEEEEVLTDQQLCNQERSSSLDQEFVNERLTAAAEEIFGVFQNTIVEYEEEIYRQRKLLDIVCKPEIKLHRIDLQQQHVCKEEEEEVLTDQQLCNQESNSSLDQEDPEPLQIKEEQEELCSSQEGEEVVLKVEADTFVVTPIDGERDHVKPEPDSDHHLFSHKSHITERQKQKGGKHKNSTRGAESEQNNQQYENRSHSNVAYNLNSSGVDSKIRKPSLKCNTCGKNYKYKSVLLIHLSSHTGEKPYLCKTCGKRFPTNSSLTVHQKIHTGEKPFICTTCGKAFTLKGPLNVHIRCVHNGEKRHICTTCGKRYSDISSLKIHQRIHTGEKPFICTTCGKAFTQKATLNVHIRCVHNGEKRHLCTTCGKRYSDISSLKIHQRIHTGEKPFICTTCGRGFTRSCRLTDHKRRFHTGERPYLCNTCGKRFIDTTSLKTHQRIHTGEKPLICTCGRAFRHASSLSVHIRRAHTGERRHLCTTCGKRFCDISALKKHQGIHTGEMPFI